MTIDPRLLNLFVEGLRLLYAAHHQGGEQARQNVGSSSLPKLQRMLKTGSELNLIQAKRLEPIFERSDATSRNRLTGRCAASPM